MSEAQTLIVVGASHAGSQLAVQARKLGWPGRIVLAGAEEALPYHRPPLSKAVMAGEKSLDDILLRPRAMYDNSEVELRLGLPVTGIDREAGTVTLDGGETLAWDRLALCTGSRVIKLSLGDGLSGVHYLRTIRDIQAIRDEISDSRRAVIIGGGYIGLEAASALSKLGLDVTVLEREERVLQRVTGEQTSRYITGLHEAHGVHVACGMEVVSINGAQRAESVSCADGRTFDADLVIIGVGIVPETGLAEQAGLRIDNGIRVDEYARTSDPAIVAAGDCTSHTSALYGRTVRLESVQNANDQSRVAAATICDKQQAYNAVPWFWSDQFDIKLQSAGLSEGHDDTVLLGEADPHGKAGFSLLYFRDDRLIAADCVNQAKVFMACKKLVGERAGRQQVLEQLA
ncbi:MAG: FAD/NAD(P)-binding oxidoreductase [Pseudohongiellaceae bacterium]